MGSFYCSPEVHILMLILLIQLHLMISCYDYSCLEITVLHPFVFAFFFHIENALGVNKKWFYCSSNNYKGKGNWLFKIKFGTNSCFMHHFQMLMDIFMQFETFWIKGFYSFSCIRIHKENWFQKCILCCGTELNWVREGGKPEQNPPSIKVPCASYHPPLNKQTNNCWNRKQTILKIWDQKT